MVEHTTDKLRQYAVLVTIPATTDHAEYRMSLCIWGTSKPSIELTVGRQIPEAFIREVEPLPYPSPTLVTTPAPKVVHAGHGSWATHKLLRAIKETKGIHES